MSLRSLLKLASGPIAALFRDEAGIGALGPRGSELCELLSLRNGFFAFEGALHVFPDTGIGRLAGLERFNRSTGWKAGYRHGCEGLFLFAANAFGDLYGIRGDEIIGFDPETGTACVIASDLDGWAAWVLERCRSEIGWAAFRRWQDLNGPLELGSRLMPVQFFCHGGTDDPANLREIPLEEGLALRGCMASQHQNLPHGSCAGLHAG
jgi:hypothetical protein